jgi:IclR family acetate operon transcriptional repressor
VEECFHIVKQFEIVGNNFFEIDGAASRPNRRPSEWGVAVSGPTGTQAVDRAGSILVRVLAAPEPVPFGELVVATELPKSTLSRLLSSLERQGLVQRTTTGAVQPGPRITDYALSVRPEDDLIRIAQPYLDELGALTGETINLAVAVGSEVRQIAQVDSTYLLGAVNWMDRPVPFHCSALGRALIAFGGTLPRGRLKAFTDKTITSRRDLEKELERVRRAGVSLVDGELEPGLIAIAAPILNGDGAAIAAVSVSGPSVRMTSDQLASCTAAVKLTARGISDEVRHITRPSSPLPRKAGAA